MQKKGQYRMTNFIIVAVLVLILGAAIFYIVKEKKKGTVCIGCPNAGTCASKKGNDSNCDCH